VDTWIWSEAPPPSAAAIHMHYSQSAIINLKERALKIMKSKDGVCARRLAKTHAVVLAWNIARISKENVICWGERCRRPEIVTSVQCCMANCAYIWPGSSNADRERALYVLGPKSGSKLKAAGHLRGPMSTRWIAYPPRRKMDCPCSIPASLAATNLYQFPLRLSNFLFPLGLARRCS
jgi:hypothetical protein